MAMAKRKVALKITKLPCNYSNALINFYNTVELSRKWISRRGVQTNHENEDFTVVYPRSSLA